MNSNMNSDILGGVDLNPIQASGLLQQSEFLSYRYVCRQNPVRAVDGFSSMDNLYPNRRPLWRQLSSPNTSLYRSVSHFGFRATDLSRESARYRSLSRSAIGEAVSHGHTVDSKALHSRRCQRKTRLENLCRLCSTTYHPGQKTVRGRRLWNRPFEYRLRSGLDDYRSVPVCVPVGAISKCQGCRENAYVARSSRQYSKLYSYLQREVPRCQSARSVAAGSWRHLYHGSSLCRLRSIVRTRSGRSLLCDARQIESSCAKTLLSSRRSFHWVYLRPDGYAHWLLLAEELSKTFASNPIQRSENWQNTDFSDQQLCAASADYYRVVSVPLAGRTVFQMDQATSSNQKVLWYNRECSKDANLDRGLGVCAGGHCQKTSQSQCFALHFITDFLSDFVRENPIKPGFSRLH